MTANSLTQSSQYAVKVSTAGNEVIASGTVHLTEPEVKFEVAGLTIKYQFLSDSEGGRFRAEVINGEMVISLFNFTNSLGEGLLKPIELGALNGRPLLATCYVNTSEGNLRRFQYSFMLGGD